MTPDEIDRIITGCADYEPGLSPLPPQPGDGLCRAVEGILGGQFWPGMAEQWVPARQPHPRQGPKIIVVHKWAAPEIESLPPVEQQIVSVMGKIIALRGQGCSPDDRRMRRLAADLERLRGH